MSGPDVWADLLDSLLLQIIALLSSFRDLLAFIGTCRSWRAAVSSLPPAFSFNFPPLHFQPDGYDPHPHRNYIKQSLLSNIKWQLVDPAKRTSSLHRLAPRYLRVRRHMRYLGCSYGYLIFSDLEQCLLVDVYSGATVRPPGLKSNMATMKSTMESLWLPSTHPIRISSFAPPDHACSSGKLEQAPGWSTLLTVGASFRLFSSKVRCLLWISMTGSIE